MYRLAYHLHHLGHLRTYALISMHVDISACIFSLHMSTYTCIYVPQARSLQAVPRLVKLFNHANQEVQRHATGAMRNLIYDNADNKLALVEENGIFELLRTLREQDDELRKNVTGTLVPPASSSVPSSALSCLVPALLFLYSPLSLPCSQQSVFILCLPCPILNFLGGWVFLLFILFITILCTPMHAPGIRVKVRGQLLQPWDLGSQTQVIGLVQKAPLPAEPFCQPIF